MLVRARLKLGAIIGELAGDGTTVLVAHDLTNGTIAVDYVSESGLFRVYPVTG